MKKLSNISYLALLEMKKGYYLTKIGKAEGICVGSRYIETIKTPIKAGTIDELLDRGYIRQTISHRNIYLLTDAGRAYKQELI